MRTSLKDTALGRWRGILPALGLPAKLLDGKHGPCPICQAGKDRFRFDDKEGRGTWFCSQCGAGDGIALVMQMRGVDFKGAAALVEPLVGVAAYQRPAAEPSDDTKRRWMRELWDGAVPITAEDPAGMYLGQRLGLSEFPPSLRYHDHVAFTDTDGAKSYGPAMLAKVSDRDGMPVNIHRTYLTYRGEKASIAKPRAMMPGTIPGGAAVRLQAAGEALGVAEGIETAFAASALHGVPCWSCINATVLSKWSPPPGVKRVLVFADNDPNFAGQHAAYQLANRIAVKDKLSVEVALPPDVGTDWDDAFRFRRTARDAADGASLERPWAVKNLREFEHVPREK